jgi:hypothetical protein
MCQDTNAIKLGPFTDVAMYLYPDIIDVAEIAFIHNSFYFILLDYM